MYSFDRFDPFPKFLTIFTVNDYFVIIMNFFSSTWIFILFITRYNIWSLS